MTEKSSNNESIRGSTTCDADGFNAKSTAVYEGSKKVGTVYLRYSNKCHAAWAKFVLDQPAPAVSGGVRVRCCE